MINVAYNLGSVALTGTFGAMKTAGGLAFAGLTSTAGIAVITTAVALAAIAYAAQKFAFTFDAEDFGAQASQPTVISPKLTDQQFIDELNKTVHGDDLEQSTFVEDASQFLRENETPVYAGLFTVLAGLAIWNNAR